jgi:putative ABC transport system permease protein
MLKGYVQIALRTFWKHKTFSVINIAGLGIGLAACLLILQYVCFELNYDQFNKNISDIYRVYNDRYQNGKLVQHGTITYSAVGPAMKSDFPEVVDNCRVEPWGGILIAGEKKLGNENMLAVDNSFLRMFTVPLLAGDADNALVNPRQAVVSERLARKLFDYSGSDFRSLIGRTFVLSRDSLPYQVTAICRNLPENTHLPYDLLLSYSTLASGGYKESTYDFTDSDFWHYIQLRHGTDYRKLETKLAAFSQRHFQGSKVSGSDEKFYLQPLSRAHLFSDFEYEIGKTGSSTAVWGLSAIAIFIILIAWVNYINLTTARSIDRAKEVGIRKVVGAERSQLVRQFLVESLLINAMALVVALVLVLVARPLFGTLLGHPLSFGDLFHHGLLGYSVPIGLSLLLISGILLSGTYPALVLSSFRPILALKGKFSRSRKGAALRQVLVVGQFAITIALIIGSAVVYRQLGYMNKQQLGFNLDQILMVTPPTLTAWDSGFFQRQISFKDEIKNLPAVLGVCTTDRSLGVDMARAFNAYRFGGNPTAHFTVRNFGVSREFIDVYGIQLIAGRNLQPTDYNYQWNSLHSLLVNQLAVREFGFANAQDALGKKLMIFGRAWDIVGVVADFHQKSLHFPIEPMVLLPTLGTGDPISIKVNPKNISATIASIRTTYNKYFPGNLFDFNFLDDNFRHLYDNDQLFGKLFALFAGLAILIACLGLLGLSLFATAQRTKEIGVRKVLGASVSHIVILLSRDFMRLVLMANLIAFPVAWWVMNQWLQNFAYKISLRWWLFGMAGLIAVVIAQATISLQALRAASAKPAESLRTE